MEQTGKFSNGRAALGLLALVILAAAQLGAQLLASLPLMVGAPVWLGNVLAGVLYAALGVAGLLLLCGKGLRVTPEECRLAPVRLRPVWAASAVLMPALAAGALLLAGDDNPFRDVRAIDWFYDDVRFANQSGLFNGVEKDLFAPEEPMTRGMLVTVLWRLDGETAPKTATTFTDVDANAYYADAVAWAAESGVVNGIGGGRFDPEGNVTREQIAAILFRYASLKGVDTAARADLTAFPDAEKTSAYAHDALSWAVAAELVKGTKEGSTIYLDPQGSATRAQVAAILSRYAQNIVK